MLIFKLFSAVVQRLKKWKTIEFSIANGILQWLPFCVCIYFYKHNAINFTKYWSLHVFIFQFRSILHLTLASGQTYRILDTRAVRTVGHKALLAVTWIHVQPFQWYYKNMHYGKISKILRNWTISTTDKQTNTMSVYI